MTNPPSAASQAAGAIRDGVAHAAREASAQVAAVPDDLRMLVAGLPSPVEAAGGLRRYLGLSDDGDAFLNVAVADVLAREGRELLSSPDRLLAALRSAGVSNVDAYALCLVTQADGFMALCTGTDAPTQADVDRVVGNAIAQTGLAKAAVTRCMTAVATALGIAYERTDAAEAARAHAGQAYVVPQSVYAHGLAQVAQALGEAHDGPVDLSDEAQAQLELALAEGLPKAKCYMGYLLLERLAAGADPGRGLELLEEASAEGDVEAASLLADWYYARGTASWGRALSLYTGYGALALTPERVEHVASIINHGSFNAATLRLCAVGVVALLALALLAPSAPAYAPHRLLGVLATLVAALTLGAAWLHARRFPYADVYHVPVVMFVAWALYMAARCVL